MANEEHPGILKQGVEGWNQWREEKPLIRQASVGLSSISRLLSKVYLSGAYLVGQNYPSAARRYPVDR
jgi:hypothetical protein